MSLILCIDVRGYFTKGKPDNGPWIIGDFEFETGVGRGVYGGSWSLNCTVVGVRVRRRGR